MSGRADKGTANHHGEPAGSAGVVACPAYAVCAAVGTARTACRYDPERLPPPGMLVSRPEDAWCPPGIATIILLLQGRAPAPRA